MASWLDSAFYSFDRKIFFSMHALCKNAGGVFTPLFKFITFLGNGGWAFIVLAVICLLFKKSRKVGLAIGVSLMLGGILTNVILKNLVDRTRPFFADEKYREFWQCAGALKVGESSFPSGHATATATAMTALFLTANKKWSWLGFILVAVMCLTRVYFTVHYTTDVIAGAIIGGICGVCSYFIVKWLYKLIDKNQDKKFCKFFTDFDIIKVITKK